MKRVTAFMAILMVFAVLSFVVTPALAQEVKRMSMEELKGKLGNPDVMVIDVRTATDRDSSSLQIKGAVREDPEKVSSWMSKYPKDKTLVFYCA